MYEQVASSRAASRMMTEAWSTMTSAWTMASSRLLCSDVLSSVSIWTPSESDRDADDWDARISFRERSTDVLPLSTWTCAASVSATTHDCEANTQVKDRVSHSEIWVDAREASDAFRPRAYSMSSPTPLSSGGW